jgi:hypothetical protein
LGKNDTRLPRPLRKRLVSFRRVSSHDLVSHGLFVRGAGLVVPVAPGKRTHDQQRERRVKAETKHIP